MAGSCRLTGPARRTCRWGRHSAPGADGRVNWRSAGVGGSAPVWTPLFVCLLKHHARSALVGQHCAVCEMKRWASRCVRLSRGAERRCRKAANSSSAPSPLPLLHLSALCVRWWYWHLVGCFTSCQHYRSWRLVPPSDSSHSWRLYSAAPLGDQTATIMAYLTLSWHWMLTHWETRAPASCYISHYPNTELILIVPG